MMAKLVNSFRVLLSLHEKKQWFMRKKMEWFSHLVTQLKEYNLYNMLSATNVIQMRKK